MLVTRHWINEVPITIGGFYGFAQGPTWPKARQLSDQLLETFTTEIVLGMSGIRIFVGDFNQEPGDLIQHQIWAQHGWCNAQELAEQTLSHVRSPTCKHVNERDQIWERGPPIASDLKASQATRLEFGDHGVRGRAEFFGNFVNSQDSRHFV